MAEKEAVELALIFRGARGRTRFGHAFGYNKISILIARKPFQLEKLCQYHASAPARPAAVATEITAGQRRRYPELKGITGHKKRSGEGAVLHPPPFHLLAPSCRKRPRAAAIARKPFVFKGGRHSKFACGHLHKQKNRGEKALTLSPRVRSFSLHCRTAYFKAANASLSMAIL